MSRNNKRKSENIKSKTVNPDFADYLAFIPGLLMTAMLFIVLILDITMPEMAEKQYEDFPGIFTAFDYAAIVSGTLYIAISLKRKDIRTEKSDICFAAFMLLIIASTAANGINEITIDGVPYRFIGIFNMFAFMLVYMGVTRSIKRESFGNVFLTAFIASADVIGLAAIYDRYMGVIPAFHEKKDLSAIFFNGNHYGYFLLMAILAGLGLYLFGERKVAAFGAASAGLNSVLLLINHSLGSILAMILVIAGTAVIILIKDRSNMKKLLIMMLVMIVAFAFAFVLSPAIRKEFAGLTADLSAAIGGSMEGSAGHRRWRMWTLTLEYISQRPLLGYGCEGISYRLYSEMAASNPHNEVLTYAAYYGVPAAILYAAGVTGAIITSIRHIDANGVQQKAACMAAAGYFLSSFVGVGMFYTMPFFFIFLGLSRKH